MTVKQLKKILKPLDGDMALIVSCNKKWHEIDSFVFNEDELIGMIKTEK